MKNDESLVSVVTNNFQLYQNDSVVLYPKKVAGKFSNKGELFDILTNAKRKNNLRMIKCCCLPRKVPLMGSHRGITRSAEVGLSLKRL